MTRTSDELLNSLLETTMERDQLEAERDQFWRLAERRENEVEQLREALRRIVDNKWISSTLAKSMAQHALNQTATFERCKD